MTVAVTGIGVVTPIGVGTDKFWDNLIAGVSGAGPVTRFDASEQPVRIAAEASDFDVTDFMSPRDAKRCDRFTQMALAAATLAHADAGEGAFANPVRVGVVVGTGIGGMETIEAEHRSLLANGPRRVSPFMVPMLMPNAAAGNIAMTYGFTGPNFAVVSACASGAHAIGEACRLIDSGACDVVLAGGSESALTPLAFAAFTRMGALSARNDDPTTASRPFDADRDGFVFGEGAGILVLERADLALRRGADVIASITGYGAAADAFHLTQPDPEGAGAQAAMAAALHAAGRLPEEVDYVNAHGTSTPYNDRIETHALKKVLGPDAQRVPVTSTKSQTGHLLGAAGAVEAAVCALAIRDGRIPATRNLQTRDPDCDLDYVADGPRQQEVRVALSNSFGFGGHNACLVIEAP